MNLSILEIAQACHGTLVLQGDNAKQDTQVDSVVLDSRKVTPGGVFVATVGERVDGHKFIPQVFEQGVVLAITEKTPEVVEQECGVAASAWGSYILVEDSFQALKDIAEFYRQKLAIKIVGITGSVGKTSTKEFIAGVLAEKYNVLKTEGNFNNEIGVPLTLLRIRDEHEIAVVEMGISDFGEMHRLSKMARPNICVITNIGQCHLENLKSREGILRAKTEIFDFMAADAEICLNGDDDMLATVKQDNLHFFGLEQTADKQVWASEVQSKGLWGSEANMNVCMNGQTESFSISVPLPGVHMVTNAAAATCVAKLLGLSNAQITEGLSKIEAVGGRGHLIRTASYTVIDDCYNANPVSMNAAIDLLDMADTEKIAILGDMFELGENSGALHAGVGAYAANSGADCILCVGANSKHMYDAAVSENEKNSCAKKIYYFATREDLMAELEHQKTELLPEGSTILVKASHGMEFAKVVEYLAK